MIVNLLDEVYEALTPDAIRPLAHVVDETVERVERSIRLLAPMVLAALAGYERRQSTRDQLLADLRGEHIDARLPASLPAAVAGWRLSSILRTGHLAGRRLFADEHEALVVGVARVSGLSETRARLTVDLTVVIVLAAVKRTVTARSSDSIQLARMLASQYRILATHIEPSLTAALGHSSVAAWLSTIGADAATCHPLRLFAGQAQRAREFRTAVIEQVLFALLMVGVGVIGMRCALSDKLP